MHQTDVRVSVMTCNVRHGQGVGGVPANGRLGRLIAASGCNLVGLNEVWRVGKIYDQPGMLGESTGYTPVFHPLHKLWGREIGNLLLSGLPVESVDYLDLGGRREPRGCLVAHVLVGQRPIVFALTHLALHRPTRTVQLAMLAERLPRDQPLVLVGDFNCGVSELEALAGVLTFPATAPATYPSVKPFRSLDHIGYSRHWELEGLRSVRTLLSDHLPLVAELRLTT